MNYEHAVKYDNLSNPLGRVLPLPPSKANAMPEIMADINGSRRVGDIAIAAVTPDKVFSVHLSLSLSVCSWAAVAIF